VNPDADGGDFIPAPTESNKANTKTKGKAKAKKNEFRTPRVLSPDRSESERQKGIYEQRKKREKKKENDTRKEIRRENVGNGDNDDEEDKSPIARDDLKSSRI
jgi:hypothetical protein